MIDQTKHHRLPTMHLGAPTVVGPLTLFPIWTDAPVPDAPVSLEPPAEATIGELDSGPTVDLLTANNPTPLPYVLLEGTIVDGGWQHRVLVHSVLVDQGDVWSRVAAYEQTYGASGTHSLVSIRALDAGDGRTIHATALNVRHDLVLAA